MKLLIAILGLMPVFGFSQTMPTADSSKVIAKNVIGFIPSKANIVNGWAIGYGFRLSSPDSSSRKINGVYTNVQPLNVLVLGFATPHLILGSLQHLAQSNNNTDTAKTSKRKIQDSVSGDTLNGIAMHLFGIGYSYGYVINGFEFCPGTISGTTLNGLSVALFAGYEDFKGCMIGGFTNYAEKGRGAQVSLINIADNFNGVQIGLLNRIGDRVTPFINFSFKR